MDQVLEAKKRLKIEEKVFILSYEEFNYMDQSSYHHELRELGFVFNNNNQNIISFP